MAFKEWWNAAMADDVIVDDYRDAYRTGQAEMRERAAEEIGKYAGIGMLVQLIRVLPLEGDDGSD